MEGGGFVGQSRFLTGLPVSLRKESGGKKSVRQNTACRDSGCLSRGTGQCRLPHPLTGLTGDARGTRLGIPHQ